MLSRRWEASRISLPARGWGRCCGGLWRPQGVSWSWLLFEADVLGIYFGIVGYLHCWQAVHVEFADELSRWVGFQFLLGAQPSWSAD